MPVEPPGPTADDRAEGDDDEDDDEGRSSVKRPQRGRGGGSGDGSGGAAGARRQDVWPALDSAAVNVSILWPELE